MVDQQPDHGQLKNGDKGKDEDRGEFFCTICKSVMKEPIQLISCNHRFCGGCYSNIYTRMLNYNKDREFPNCPDCGSTVTKVNRDLEMNLQVSKFLKANPDIYFRKSPEHFNLFKRTADDKPEEKRDKLVGQKRKLKTTSDDQSKPEQPEMSGG